MHVTLVGHSVRVVKAIVGSRVILRPMEVQDFKAWRDAKARNQEWVSPWEPAMDSGVADPAIDKGAFRARCATWSRQWNLGTAYAFGIFLRDGGLVGEIHLSNVLRGPFQNGMVGYWIDREQAGQGLAPEAIVLLLQFAFEDLRLHRVEIAIVPRNKASLRVAEKLGLREEGLAVGYLQIQGIWEDHVRYALTTVEWSERGRKLLDGHVHHALH